MTPNLPPRVPSSDVHHRQLEWFLDRAHSLVYWPKPLADGSRLVTKAKGIYKPRGQPYVVSVYQTLNSPYRDRDPVFAPDGGWFYEYHQEGHDPANRDSEYTNRALMYCWEHGVPVGVMRQESLTPHSRYRVLGVAYVTDWDAGWFRFESTTSLPSVEEFGRFVLQGGDGRAGRMAPVVQRPGQQAFRDTLLTAYGCCQVTGTTVIETLEAAHIHPDRGPVTNHISNGLLLRADLHCLFDVGLMTVHPTRLIILVAPELQATPYGQYHGRPLLVGSARRPSREALRWHFANVGWEITRKA